MIPYVIPISHSSTYGVALISEAQDVTEKIPSRKATQNQTIVHASIVDAIPTSSDLEEVHVATDITPNDGIIANTIFIYDPIVCKESFNTSSVQNILNNNRYTALGSSEMAEELHDPDIDSDMLDLMTPLRLEARTGEKEIQSSSKTGGRRNRRRGNQGGHG